MDHGFSQDPELGGIWCSWIIFERGFIHYMIILPMYLASVFSSGAANVSHVAHSKMEAFVPPFAHQSRFGVPPGAAECAAGDAIIHRQPPRGGPGAGCFFAGSPAGPPFDSLSPPPPGG